jgi:hypothetical protein
MSEETEPKVRSLELPCDMGFPNGNGRLLSEGERLGLVGFTVVGETGSEKEVRAVEVESLRDSCSSEKVSSGGYIHLDESRRW